MATVFGEPLDQSSGKTSIVDDFMYGSNVASSHFYIRLGFLRKVYGILSAQLLVTLLVGILFVTVEGVESFVKQNDWLLLVVIILSFVTMLATMVKSKEVPTNYICLAAFTLCEAFLVGVIVTMYTVSSVLEALALTCAVTFGLTAYTLQSKRDFSSWGAGLYAALCVLVLSGLMQLFFQSVLIERALGAAGALLFSLYIIYDTHMIMKKVSPEEYIHAAVLLYMDIINLFLEILRAMGERRK
jgi:protein lifeguard